MTTPVPFLGIDLGTTYSALARLDVNGRPETIFNSLGKRSTPSAVSFEGDDIIVGEEALKAMDTDALQVADSPKRDIGRAAFRHPILGQDWPPEVIQAYILDRLRRDAVQQIGEVRHAVITVPAYFDEPRRKATQDAGYMAGLEVLDIINEPTAAAIAYGFQNHLLSSSADPKAIEAQPSETVSARPATFLVYDLGGGTFDVTVMRVEDATFRTLATDGDAALGGRDWDDRLLNLVADSFLQEHGLDFRGDPIALGRMWRICEDAKRTLSLKPKARVHCDYEGYTSRCVVTRDEFEKATSDLLERTRFTTQQVLRDAGLDWNDIDHLLPVGGSTRMPMVQSMLRELSGKEPAELLSVDEAVAHGAAIHAGQLIAQSSGVAPTCRIRNVNSHSLGVVGKDPATARARVGVIIPKNTGIPVRAKRTFTTQKGGQRTILVEVVEGESALPDACTPIGRCRVEGLPDGLPAKTPVDVYFQYDANGRLRVLVDLPGHDCQLQTELVRHGGLSREQLDSWRERIIGRNA